MRVGQHFSMDRQHERGNQGAPLLRVGRGSGWRRELLPVTAFEEPRSSAGNRVAEISEGPSVEVPGGSPVGELAPEEFETNSSVRHEGREADVSSLRRVARLGAKSYQTTQLLLTEIQGGRSRQR